MVSSLVLSLAGGLVGPRLSAVGVISVVLVEVYVK